MQLQSSVIVCSQLRKDEVLQSCMKLYEFWCEVDRNLAEQQELGGDPFLTYQCRVKMWHPLISAAFLNTEELERGEIRESCHWRALYHAS